jgi:tetratricopeptide (TPR) repeat protein/CHAT domain-containing protein
MKTILLYLFFLFSLKAYTQNEAFKRSHSEYEKAIEDGNFLKALSSIDICIYELEQLGIKDTLYSNTLFEKAEILYYQESYEDALKLGERAFEIEKSILGEDHLYVANSNDFFSKVYQALKGNEALAINFAQQALNIRIRLLGLEHSKVARSLINLAQLYSEMGQYEKALPLQELAVSVYKKGLGEEHPEVARSLNNLALLYFKMGQYEKTLPLQEQALKIDKKTLGEDHPDVARSLNNLAQLYSDMGQYEKALPLQEQALSIIKKALGDDHPTVAMCLNNLAAFYSRMGQYEKALPLQEQALKVRKKALGEEHPDVATSLNNLAQLYSEMGQYEKALPLQELALKVNKKALGEEHPNVAAILNNLALLYSEMGQYEKALPLIEQALLIRKKALGVEHPDAAASLSSLALLYSEMGQYEKALPLQKQALSVLKITLGEEHPNVATSLNSLAQLYSKMGQYEKALPLHEQALKVHKKVLGDEHPDVATSLNGLALLYFEIGKFEKALPLLEQALKVSKKALGEEHPSVAARLNILGLLYYKMGQYEKALPLNKKALEIHYKHLKNTLPSLSDMGKIALVKQIDYTYEFYDGLLILNEPKKNSVIFSVNNNLFLNNLNLRSNENMRKSILTSNDTLLIADFETWLSLKRQYANVQSLSLHELKNNGIDLKALEDSIEIKERWLSKRSQAFQTEQQILELNYETLKANLNAEEATVMFHSFNYYNGKDWSDSTLYTAYIIRKDQKQPEMVYLFEQAALDTLLPAPDTRSMMNNLYQTGDSALYNLVWKPLEPYLKGVKTAYVSPSGLLHKIAFAAVPLTDGSRLSDRYLLRQVLSGHDVVFKEDPAVFNNSSTTTVALLGGINYEYLPEVKDTVYFSPLSLLPESTDRGTAFGYLPGTESEVSSIEKLLKNDKVNVTLLKGNNATEEQFKTLQGDKAPKVLHIATHGFFAPDPKRDLNKENSICLMGQENRYTSAENPLYRSGLMLAGGNSSWTKKTTLPADQDGVLTAYEVANMDLSNTQLVVLSACETALGDVKGREGVFGLQRGFRLAGAKYMLISLWRIPDKETAEYMTKFYSELAKTNNIVTSYQTTQNYMKTTYPNEPQKWAGMVLVE